jgi:2-dehydro-3-deoxygalactonokinase
VSGYPGSFSILASPGAGSDDAFRRGVRRAREAGGLLHHLFGTRALGLMGDLAPEETESYLSGLLIGHEVQAAIAEAPPDGPVHLAGAATLCHLYALAFEAHGLDCRLHDPDIAAHGLALIGRSLA